MIPSTSRRSARAGVVVLGTGLQGRAVLHDLERAASVLEIVAADEDLPALQAHLRDRRYRKTRAVALDAADGGALRRVLRESGAGVVVSMVPPDLAFAVAEAAVEVGLSYVSSNYAGRLTELDRAARAAGVTLLPEMGMDPGIDLLLGRWAVDQLDRVTGLLSYGAGIPEPGSANNPLRYKITWTFEGVLRAYLRPARLRRAGRDIEVAANEMFAAAHVERVTIPGVGEVEAYPNGDALRYVELFGLADGMTDMGRYAFRWPGHSALWKTLVDLGFLDETPIEVDGARISPRQFLRRHLEPRLQFSATERDLAAIHVEARGAKGGRPAVVRATVIDYRDLDTGLFAMNRTVGYTASIAAQLILSGRIAASGLLNPARDVPVEPVLDELVARGMRVTRTLA